MEKEKKLLVENQFGHGAIKSPIDSRRLSYDKNVLAVGLIDIDWDKGYDIRNKLGDYINFKNQWGSSSCTGQGASYYLWVKQVVESINKRGMDLKNLRNNYPEDVEEISAKALYSQVYLPGGGAYIHSPLSLAIKWGALVQSIVPDHKEDGSTDEKFMTDNSWLNDKINNIARILKGQEYRIIEARSNMDLFAQAIIQNDGVVGGVVGTNNGTWNSESPKPPTSNSNTWGHCLFYGSFGKDEKGKFIATPNSWGNILGKRNWQPGDPPGFGWQKLREDYFNSEWQFDPFTYTDKDNSLNIDSMQFFKDKKTSNIYMIIDGKKIMIIDMPTLVALDGEDKFVEIDNIGQYPDGGTIAWFNRIIQ